MKRIAAAPFALLMAGCGHEPPVAQKSPTPVNVTAIEMFTPSAGQRYSATIVPARQVVLGFHVNGVVESIGQVRDEQGRMRNLQAGDAVTEGAVLARVRQKDFEFQVSQANGQVAEARRGEEAARAQLAQAQAGAAKAAKDLERATFLYENKSLTRPDFDGAKAQFDASKAQVDAAQAQVRGITARIGTAEAGLGAASLTRDETVLRSPLNGVVVQRNVETGALAGPAAPAFAIAEMDPVKAVFGAPDVVAVKLRQGLHIPIEVEALAGHQFSGVITSIAPVADAATRLFQVEITVANPRKLLRPGMIAAIALGEQAKASPTPVIPLSAVIRGGSGPESFAVMVIDGNVARRRPVSLGETWGDKIGVVSGLTAGERVVTRGASGVENGEQVEVIP